MSFDLNVLADHAALTPGHHFLDAVLVDPSGNQVSLAHIDLATMVLAANHNPLGYASGWTTIKASPAAGALLAGTPYQLEFLLTNDLAGTGQAVAVAIDNLSVSQPGPQLGISDSAKRRRRRAGRSSSGPARAAPVQTVNLSNPGIAPVIVAAGASPGGRGFTLPNALTGPFTLDPGDVVPIQVQVVNSTQPAAAALQITSDDSNEPLYILPLQYETTSTAPLNYPPVPAPIPDQRVSPGGAVTVTASATNPVAGQTLTYSLDPGAPAGAAINPTSGAFTWMVPAGETPGAYPVTVRVTDNGSPPLGATQTFTIDVLQPTSLVVAPASGTYGTTATNTLSATLTAGGSPLTGTPVTFILAGGGQTANAGHGDDRLERRGVPRRREPCRPAGGNLSRIVIASFSGDSNNAFSAGSGGLTVTQATPSVTWPAPADITQGQALGAAQLDAMGSVPGTFTYLPATKTVLPAGMGQSLTAVFTPADTTDYKSAMPAPRSMSFPSPPQRWRWVPATPRRSSACR